MHSNFAAIIVILSAVALFSTFGCLSGQQKQDTNATILPSASVIFQTPSANWTVSVEIASTDATREQGLMFRQYLEEGKGMLFIFDKPSKQYFWMKNTLIPLDIIYIYQNLTIAKISHDFAPCKIEPCELDSSPDGVLYVVEVPAGWSEKYGVRGGQPILLSQSP